MNTLHFVARQPALRRGLLTLLAAALSATAQAGSPFSHPALRGGDAAASGSAQANAAAPRLVGHPASPRWALVHANGEHPAVIVSRRATGALDPNTFLVQPPASARWTDPARDKVELAAGQQAR